MCGIFGIYNFDFAKKDLATKSLYLLEHRGPDQWGEEIIDNIYLGSRRLSILDLSEKGRQPLTDLNRQVFLTYNGEIYNFRELKKELIEKNYSFKSNTDTEVILYGYIEWGLEKLLKKLDGMYAFLLYDSRDKTFYAVRDKFGKKPIFFFVYNNEYIFSSEIKAIFNYCEKAKVFSKEGIVDWLYNRGSRTGLTIYHNVRKVLPGTYLMIRDSSVYQKTFYDFFEIVSNSNNKTNGNYIEEFENRLDVAVKKRLISDVPVGIQLSGGIDSSLISYFLRKNHSGKIHTFSIGFSNPDFKYFSEEKYSTLIARKLGLEHHQINIDQKDIVEHFEKVTYLTDGMMDIPNTIAIYILSKYAKNYITVILTGEGADESFGGYTKLNFPFKLAISKRCVNFFPSFLFEIVGKINYAKIKNLIRIQYLKKNYTGKLENIIKDLNCYISPSTLNGILKNNFQVRRITHYDRRILNSNINTEKKFLYYEVVDYLFTILERQDRATMGASIESRLPFLDPILLEWAFTLPPKLLFDGKENKILLKIFSEKIFGRDFTYRKKLGFPLPIYKWLDDENGLGYYVRRIFDNNSVLNEIVDTNVLKMYINSNSFDNKLLAYPDSEKMWIKWFLTALRTAEQVFEINDII